MLTLLLYITLLGSPRSLNTISHSEPKVFPCTLVQAMPPKELKACLTQVNTQYVFIKGYFLLGLYFPCCVSLVLLKCFIQTFSVHTVPVILICSIPFCLQMWQLQLNTVPHLSSAQGRPKQAAVQLYQNITVLACDELVSTPRLYPTNYQ